jgi:hypothetical protein
MDGIVFLGLVVIGVPVGLTAINILQNGLGGYKGQPMDVILGCPAEAATVTDLARLSKAQLMQLFYAAPVPHGDDLDGEYEARLIPVGVLAGVNAVYTRKFFGPGRWIGKAFTPLKNSSESGYNLFRLGQGAVARTRPMRTYIGPSNIDRNQSFHLDYRPYNSGLVHGMHDEIRRINTELFLGMGCMALGGGSINPAPFAICGPAKPWVGPDADPGPAGS